MRPDDDVHLAGGEIGQADHKLDCNQFANIGAKAPITCDTKDTAYRVFAGYQFHRAFSVEGGYANLGKPTVTDATGSGEIDSTLWDLSVIGALPVGPVSIFGRLGGFAGKTEIPGKSHDKLGYLFGAGVGFDIGKNIGRGEWKRYLKTGGGELMECICLEDTQHGAAAGFRPGTGTSNK